MAFRAFDFDWVVGMAGISWQFRIPRLIIHARILLSIFPVGNRRQYSNGSWLVSIRPLTEPSISIMNAGIGTHRSQVIN